MNPKTSRTLRIVGNLVALLGALLVVFGQGELAWMKYVGIFIAGLGFLGIVASMFVRRQPPPEAENDETNG